MTDQTNAAAPLSTDEQAQLADLQKRANAAAQAKADAARTAVVQLVASDTFKTALADMEAALGLASKEQRLSYAVNMMEQLRDIYAA